MTTLQLPLPSGFTAFSTAEDVAKGVDLTGKTAIVTGGYSGLGLETVRVFLNAGARVIVPARDTDRAKTALKGLTTQNGLAAEIRAMDLLAPATITAFAEDFLAENIPLDILVNSAGIMALPERTLDARGFEVQFATNHFGHFQLTAQLWPALVKAQGARVVSVSSKGHRFSEVVFDDIHFDARPYDPWKAYGQSKTANALFALALDSFGKKDGVRAYSVHPGGIFDTNLARYLPHDAFKQGGILDAFKAAGIMDANGHPIIDPNHDLKTIAQGTATQVWCALSPQLADVGGVYCENSDIAPLLPAGTDGNPFKPSGMALGGVFAHAVDPAAAERLWEISEKALGFGF